MFYWGYRFVDVVQGKGEISVRGDIIDLFPPDQDYAVRICLFDDEIESLRFWLRDAKSDKEELESLRIIPALFALDQTRYETMEKRIEHLKSDSFTKDMHSLGLWVLGEYADNYVTRFRIRLAGDIDDELEEIALFNEEEAASLRALPKIPEATRFRDIDIASSNLKTFLELHRAKKITLLAKNELLLRMAELDSSQTKFTESERIVTIMSQDEVIFRSINPSSKPNEGVQISYSMN